MVLDRWKLTQTLAFPGREHSRDPVQSSLSPSTPQQSHWNDPTTQTLSIWENKKSCFPGVDPVITHVTAIVLETLQVGDLAGFPLWTLQLVWVLELGVLVKSGRRREALASPHPCWKSPTLPAGFVKQPWFSHLQLRLVTPGWGEGRQAHFSQACWPSSLNWTVRN